MLQTESFQESPSGTASGGEWPCSRHAFFRSAPVRWLIIWVEGHKSLVTLAQLGILKGHSSLRVACEKMKEKYNERAYGHLLNSPICHIYLHIDTYTCKLLNFQKNVSEVMMHHPEIYQHLLSKNRDTLLHSHIILSLSRDVTLILYNCLIYSPYSNFPPVLVMSLGAVFSHWESIKDHRLHLSL